MKKFHLLSLLLSFAAGAFAQEAGKTYALTQGNKVVFVNNAELANGKVLVMWSDTQVPAQRWLLEKRDDGTYTLLNQYSNLYLGANGTNAGATADQRIFSNLLTRWNLEPSGQGYKIVSATNADICLAADGNADGAALTLVAKADSDPAATVFTLTDDNNFPSAYTEAVRDDIMDGFINQYYHPASVGHVLGGGGWWGDAEMFETILDAFATTGDQRYKDMFHELYVNFCSRNGTDWSGNEYNDDITWMVLACIRAYKYFGDADYLNKAKDNYTKMYNRAKQKFGTLIWKQSQENKLATNSCINCPATIAACYLGRMTGDKTWFDKAISIYDGQRKLLFNADNGEVWDSRAWNSDGTGASDFNHWVSTYNQGTMLGAAMALYDYTKDEKYLQDAHKVYAKSVSSLTNNNKIVHVCQTINGDLCGFKGILMRYVRLYAEAQHLEEPILWMEKNAWHAYQNRNSGGVIWSAWLTKTAENLKRVEGDSEKDVTNDAFGASTAVSAAFNAHVNRQFVKDAAEGLAAKNFDDIQFMQLQDDVTTPSALNGAYICFRNVDFGTEGLNKATARVNATAGRSFMKLYVDSITEASMLGRNAGFINKEWQDVSVDLNRTLTGVHDVYVEFSGTGVQFDNIRFSADNSAIQEVAAANQAPMTISGREINVTCSADSILNVYDIMGALILSSKNASSLTLQPGIYICHLSTDSNQDYTLKIIIK